MAFWAPTPPFLNGFGGFWSHFQNPKMGHPPPATSYTITAPAGGFSLKVDFQGTLDRESAWGPPIFIDFLLTNSSRKKRSPFHVAGGEGEDGGLIWAVRSGRLGLGS